MKIASFNGGRIGIVERDEIIDVSEVVDYSSDTWPPIGMLRFIRNFAALRPALESLFASAPRHALASVRLETPIAWPNKIIAFPANYHAHITEMKDGIISAFPASGQGFFLKANSSLCGPHDPIILPKIPGREVHHESEIAIIIGKGGREIAPENALDHIFGYACLVDVVIRGKEERVMRKSFDSFCPVGPWIVTADEIDDPNYIELSLTINGSVRQQANTKALIVGISEMIVMASSVMTLHSGDIIATGTPAGVGPLADGDILEITVEGVGSMRLNVVQSNQGEHPVWAKS